MTKNEKDIAALESLSEDGRKALGLVLLKSAAWTAFAGFVAGVAFAMACLGIVWAAVT